AVFYGKVDEDACQRQLSSMNTMMARKWKRDLHDLLVIRCLRRISVPVSRSVFVSYSWNDSEHFNMCVNRIVNLLTLLGLHVYFDKRCVKRGDRIMTLVEKISSADMVVVMLSNDYVQKLDASYPKINWVATEFSRLQQRIH